MLAAFLVLAPATMMPLTLNEFVVCGNKIEEEEEGGGGGEGEGEGEGEELELEA